MKKALSLLITAAMIVAIFAVTAPAALAAEMKTVGTADELIDVVTKINDGTLSADTNITLSANIDLSGKSWTPLHVYSGTFDGAGHTVTGATVTATVANNNDQKLDGGAQNKNFVIAEYPGASDGNFGEVGFALLAVKAENATFKNFTLKDGTVNTTINFNRNWQMHYGGVVAYMVNGTISNVDLVNVDIPVHANASDNQPFLGFAGIMAGVTMGRTAIRDCSIDSTSSVDASDNAKYDVAAYVGRHSSASPITVTGCTTAAAVTACATADRSGFHDNQKNDSSAIGCWAAAIVARFNDNTEAGVYDVLLDCANTGAISGAHKNDNTKIFTGDLNSRTRVRYSYTAPGGLVGSVVEAHAKTWVVSDEKIYAPKDGILLFDQGMEEGKIEATIVTDGSTTQCNGIIFCATDADDDCNFWSGSDVIYYFLFIDEGNRLRLAIDGGYNAEGVYTGPTGWKEFVSGADQVDLDTAGYDVTRGVKLGVEYDDEGHVKCYINGDLIYDLTIPEDSRLPGTKFGLRLIGEEDKTYVTSVVATVKCDHAHTEIVNAKDATATEDGYTGDKVCSDCGTTLETGKTIPAIGTTDPVTPPPTGDGIVVAGILVASLLTAAVVIARKRKIEE
ncbi:MAG: hypothetical protein ACI3YH_00415 [Eubacteriales bacterium]